ncbi:MAG: hypothetical protein FJ387_19520 [Verrucomicrobia bacterium]|nr:hypothetical protein [Verrucomicrobiota bacterium]
MKAASTVQTFLKRSLGSRIPQVALMLGLVVAVAGFSGSGKDKGSYKLGGTWVGLIPGESGDVTWITTQTADSSGHTARATLEWITNGDFEFVALDLVGADRASQASTFTRMTGKNTAREQSIWYLSTAPLRGEDGSIVGPSHVVGIAVMDGELTFIDPDTTSGTYHLKIYKTWGVKSMVPADGMELVLELDLPIEELGMGPIYSHRVF